jgi:hypothetical protein
MPSPTADWSRAAKPPACAASIEAASAAALVPKKSSLRTAHPTTRPQFIFYSLFRHSPFPTAHVPLLRALLNSSNKYGSTKAGESVTFLQLWSEIVSLKFNE